MSIKDVIKRRGFTLEQLAARMTDKQGNVGIKQSSVSQMINGNPTLEKIKEIAAIIGVTPSELITDGEYSEFVFLGRVGNESFMATSLTELKAIVNRLEGSCE